MTLVSLADVAAAADRLRGVVRETPLVAPAAGEAWAHVRLKCENLQAVGAFKYRGASNFLAQLPAGVRARGVITYSSGNHGQALAMAARRHGVAAVVVMPTTAPRVKVEGAKALGAEVHFAGTTSAERLALAETLARERGLTIVPPFEHPWIIAGQGTVGLEVLAQAPDVTAVYVPVGGGGLLAGVAAAVKRSRPGVKVVGVEAEGAAKMRASLDAGAPVTLASVKTIADGLMPVRPGDLTFAHARELVDDVVTVSDGEIAAAVRWIAREAKLVAEPSGAASLAALQRLAPPGSAGVHVAIVSGGNVEAARLAELLAADGVEVQGARG